MKSKTITIKIINISTMFIVSINTIFMLTSPVFSTKNIVYAMDSTNLIVANSIAANAIKPDLPSNIFLPQPTDSQANFEYFVDTFLPKIFGWFIAAIGVFGLIFILIGGIEFLTAYGNDQNIETAKKTVQNAVIGTVIGLLSYSIVLAINNLSSYFNSIENQPPTNPLNPPPSGTFDKVPKGDLFKDTAPGIIRIILEITGYLLFAAIVVAAIMLITARGKEDGLKKGKEILKYSVMGLIIIAIAYAVIYGVASLDFFNPIG
ncbi:hypothetical protein HYV57_03480 [Candidatus Peregrinibacteria bacterium]|nr:hypothetical protein [Candidatus Peregrinibacteria bacterium]